MLILNAGGLQIRPSGTICECHVKKRKEKTPNNDKAYQRRCRKKTSWRRT